MPPLLSIVIANYNYGRFLEEAIQSVVNQKMGDQVELIICDAASTDNSVEIIKKYADGLPANTLRSEWLSPLPHSSFLITWWCSEPDGGQSAAFNKGFSHARGKYLTWLNADDIIPLGALNKVLLEMRRHPSCEWFTGNFFRFLEDGQVIEVGWGPHWYPYCLQTKKSPLVIFGPTTFFSKRIYEEVGRIDESLHYVMDNDLWCRFIVSGFKQRRINIFCWGFRMHEKSKTAQFGSHRLSPEICTAMNAEKSYYLARSGYSPSKVLRYILLLMRVIDGSFFRRIWYQIMFKKVRFS